MTEEKKTHSDQGRLVEDNDDIMTSSTSIVIDLEDLSSHGPSQRPFVEEHARPSTPMERVTFSNLEALVPDKIKPPPAEELVEPEVRRATPPADAVSVHEVRPPSLFRFVLLFLVVILLLVTTFVGWRVDWQWSQVIDDPNAIFRSVVNGPATKDTSETSEQDDGVKQPSVVEPETGQLEFTGVSLEAGQDAVYLVGTLKNKSNRVHRSIKLEIKLMDAAGNAFYFDDKVPCCAPADEPVILAPDEQIQFRLPVDLKGRSLETVRASAKTKYSIDSVPE